MKALHYRVLESCASSETNGHDKMPISDELWIGRAVPPQEFDIHGSEWIVLTITVQLVAHMLSMILSL